MIERKFLHFQNEPLLNAVICMMLFTRQLRVVLYCPRLTFSVWLYVCYGIIC